MTTASSAPPALVFAHVIAGEARIATASVSATLRLLSDGATVPFIARYRKEATGSLDEVQIRAIQERAAYLVDLDERRATVRRSIAEQGKLTPELEARIKEVATKAELEDLYLPFRPKRRTRAQARWPRSSVSQTRSSRASAARSQTSGRRTTTAPARSSSPVRPMQLRSAAPRPRASAHEEPSS